jgi:hypothetical protein
MSMRFVFLVTITSAANHTGTTFKGFLIEVFIDQSYENQFMGGEFTVPDNAHQSCDGVRLL